MSFSSSGTMTSTRTARRRHAERSDALACLEGRSRAPGRVPRRVRQRNFMTMRKRQETMTMQEGMLMWKMIVMRLSGPSPHPGHHSCCPRPRPCPAQLVLQWMKKRIACSRHQLRIFAHTFVNNGHLRLRLHRNTSHGRVAVH